MKILIYSPLFYPSIGGVETIISTLAHEFIYQGHEVKLISQVPTIDSQQFPFEVIRQPTQKQLLKLTNWCEVYFQGCVSLKGIWPLIFVPRPFIVSHHTWYSRTDGSESWQDYLKKIITVFTINISVSHAIAQSLPVPSYVIPNSYREDIFYEIPGITRDQDLVFLGRLVSDKGINILLEALANLKSQGLTPSLTVIGSGPEEPRLRQQIQELQMMDQVTFAGVKVNQELAQLLNSHKIMVVPSLWNEPFGIVALEGIACGCVVIGSEGGGLKDAIGLAGITFPNGNVDRLVQVLSHFLSNPDQLQQYRLAAPEHLQKHTPQKVAKAYLDVFKRALK